VCVSVCVSVSVSVRACLPACLPACVSACLRACVRVSVCAYLWSVALLLFLQLIISGHTFRYSKVELTKKSMTPSDIRGGTWAIARAYCEFFVQLAPQIHYDIARNALHCKASDSN
jgi:hypothetical protein